MPSRFIHFVTFPPFMADYYSIVHIYTFSSSIHLSMDSDIDTSTDLNQIFPILLVLFCTYECEYVLKCIVGSIQFYHLCRFMYAPTIVKIAKDFQYHRDSCTKWSNLNNYPKILLIWFLKEVKTHIYSPIWLRLL